MYGCARGGGGREGERECVFVWCVCVTCVYAFVFVTCVCVCPGCIPNAFRIHAMHAYKCTIITRPIARTLPQDHRQAGVEYDAAARRRVCVCVCARARARVRSRVNECMLDAFTLHACCIHICTACMTNFVFESNIIAQPQALGITFLNGGPAGPAGRQGGGTITGGRASTVSPVMVCVYVCIHTHTNAHTHAHTHTHTTYPSLSSQLSRSGPISSMRHATSQQRY